MTDEELKRLEALCAKAMPGPWTFVRTGKNSIDDMCGTPADPEDDARVIITDSGHYPPRVPDAEFIAAARTAVPALIAEVRERRESNAHALNWLEALKRDPGLSEDSKTALVYATNLIGEVE